MSISSRYILISIFLILTFVLTSVLVTPNSSISSALAQASPALITVLCVVISKNKMLAIQNLGLLVIGRFKWYLISILLPFFAILFSYSSGTLLNLFSFHFYFESNPFKFIYHFLILTLWWPLVWAFGEELGWRGFLQPKLIDIFGIKKGLLMTGIIWGAWHVIFIVNGGYYQSGNVFLNTLFLIITVTLMSIAIGYVRLKSQSIWPCVLFHSASNAAWQMWMAQFKPISTYAVYFSGEAGIFNILFWMVCAFYFLIELNNRSGLPYCAPRSAD